MEYTFSMKTAKFGEHGGYKPRIVRIGTHKNGNFPKRIGEHYLLNESKMNFDRDKPKPSDRSIFRKNIGRALLNKANDDYLSIWDIDFIVSKNKNFKFAMVFYFAQDLRVAKWNRLCSKS